MDAMQRIRIHTNSYISGDRTALPIDDIPNVLIADVRLLSDKSHRERARCDRV